MDNIKHININGITTSCEGFADLAGIKIEALFVKTHEVNRSNEPFFRVDYLNPISNVWQYGPTFAFKTLKGIVERGDLPKV